MQNLTQDSQACKDLVERAARLRDKIDRAFWCLNLLLLDGFSREELNGLSSEVARFRHDCERLSWREAA
jgi:hypothetical protein